MNNSDMPASPVRNCNNEVVNLADGAINSNDFTQEGKKYSIGLTKREHFAAMAMQGILSNGTFEGEGNRVHWLDLIAENSVQIADALLKELEK
jgi:hypothetical protein